MGVGDESICFLAFLQKEQKKKLFLSKAIEYFFLLHQRLENIKKPGKKVCHNRILNRQPPGHQSDTLPFKLTERAAAESAVKDQAVCKCWLIFLYTLRRMDL